MADVYDFRGSAARIGGEAEPHAREKPGPEPPMEPPGIFASVRRNLLGAMSPLTKVEVTARVPEGPDVDR